MAQIQNLRKIRVNQSMTKPVLWLGCDRLLLIGTTFFMGYFGFVFGIAQGKAFVTLLAIVLWISINFGLRVMGKKDPEMREVFLRYLRYEYRYPACGTVHSREQSSVKSAWLPKTTL